MAFGSLFSGKNRGGDCLEDGKSGNIPVKSPIPPPGGEPQTAALYESADKIIQRQQQLR